MVAGIIAYAFGGVYGWAFTYGAVIGVISFTSIALTAALMGGRFTGERILLGLAVYVGRLVFAAVAIGVPIYFGALPALAMVGGFAGVYVVENIALLMAAPRSVDSAARRVGGATERRTGV